MTATGSNSPKLTYAEAKARKKRREITHPVMTDDDAVVAYQTAEEALRKAKVRGDQDEVDRLEVLVADAETAVRESALLYKLRALPRLGDNSYAALKAEHPPTAADDAEVRERSGNPKDKASWHIATFGPALVAACLIEPEVTPEQALEMAAEWNEAEWDSLVWAALTVNQQATNTAGLLFS